VSRVLRVDSNLAHLLAATRNAAPFVSVAVVYAAGQREHEPDHDKSPGARPFPLRDPPNP
jgi:hypothetical protein